MLAPVSVKLCMQEKSLAAVQWSRIELLEEWTSCLKRLHPAFITGQEAGVSTDTSGDLPDFRG